MLPLLPPSGRSPAHSRGCYGGDPAGYVKWHVPIHLVVRRFLTVRWHEDAGWCAPAKPPEQVAAVWVFDTEGPVIAEGPEFEIENAATISPRPATEETQEGQAQKASTERFRDMERESTFDRHSHIDAAITGNIGAAYEDHYWMLNGAEQGGDARYRVRGLLHDDSAEPGAEGNQPQKGAGTRIFQTLPDTNVIETETASRRVAGANYLRPPTCLDTISALLDQPAPFAGSLELLDPEPETACWITVEATLE